MLLGVSWGETTNIRIKSMSELKKNTVVEVKQILSLWLHISLKYPGLWDINIYQMENSYGLI